MEIFKIDELIKYCLTRKSAYSIKDAIDSILSDDTEHNYRLILGIMEEIEIQYPNVIGMEDFHEKEISMFSEEDFDFADPIMEFTYSYIMHIGESSYDGRNVPKKAANNSNSDEKTFDSNDGGSNINNEAAIYSVTHENTFDSTFSSNTLASIGQKLMDNKFIEVIPMEDFLYAFQCKPLRELKTKIKWLKIYNNKNDNIPLAILLRHLCPAETSKNYKCVYVKLKRVFENAMPWAKDIRSFENSLRNVNTGKFVANVNTETMQVILE